MTRSPLSAVLLVASAAAMAACGSGDSTPTGVAGGPLFAVGDRNENYGVTPGVVNVCVFYPWEGQPMSHPTTFRTTAPSGEDVIAGDYVINPLPSCIEVWNATSANVVAVSNSLVAPNLGYGLDRIVTAVGDGVTDPTIANLYGVSSATVNVSNVAGAYVWFKMKKVELPPEGGQGCTPGYWRQSHHFDSWTAPYTPSTPFSNVFANAFPGMTLHQVVSLGGGGLNALGRSAVAALLNASSAGVSYDYSVQQVISKFNTAFATGNRRAMEEQKNVFDFLNNQGCPLN